MRIDAIPEHVAAATANGSQAVLDALAAFPGDNQVAQVALGALFRVWGGGVAPFDRVAVPTAAIAAMVMIRVDVVVVPVLHLHALILNRSEASPVKI